VPVLQEYHPFLRTLVASQLFNSFILDRSSVMTDLPRVKQLLFVDWCIAIERAPSLDAGYFAKMEQLLSSRYALLRTHISVRSDSVPVTYDTVQRCTSRVFCYDTEVARVDRSKISL